MRTDDVVIYDGIPRGFFQRISDHLVRALLLVIFSFIVSMTMGALDRTNPWILLAGGLFAFLIMVLHVVLFKNIFIYQIVRTADDQITLKWMRFNTHHTMSIPIKQLSITIEPFVLGSRCLKLDFGDGNHIHQRLMSGWSEEEFGRIIGEISSIAKRVI